jgi:hypothetical protein
MIAKHEDNLSSSREVCLSSYTEGIQYLLQVTTTVLSFLLAKLDAREDVI